MTTRDTLRPKQVMNQTGWTRQYVNFLQSIPELWGLVQTAVNNDWFDSPVGQKKFQTRFESSKWFRENAASARGYLMAEAQGGADFDMKRETAREIIRARAQQLGAELSDEALESFTTAYFMNGWDQEGRQVFLDRALAGELEGFDTSFIDFTKGGPQSIVAKLRNTARLNGVRYSDDYYESAARSVIAGLSTVQDYDAEIRQQAAGAMPQYADRVLAGENVRDIMSAHIDRYARMFDLDPNAVELDDPNLKIAFNSVDDKGNPTTMGLWDYEKALRKTDGWQYTRDAHNKVADITGEIVRMFGYGG